MKRGALILIILLFFGCNGFVVGVDMEEIEKEHEKIKMGINRPEDEYITVSGGRTYIPDQEHISGSKTRY